MEIPIQPPMLQYLLSLICLGNLKYIFDQMKDDSYELIKLLKDPYDEEKTPILHTIQLVHNSNPVEIIYPFSIDQIETFHWHWIDTGPTYQYPSDIAAIGKTKNDVWFLISASMCGVSGLGCGLGTVLVFLSDNWRNLWLYGLDDKMRYRYMDPIENGQIKFFTDKYLS